MADFRVNFNIQQYQGGYEGEDFYPDKGYYPSKDCNAGDSGEFEETYHFTDTNYILNPAIGHDSAFLNRNSTKVFITVKDKWTSKKLDNNRIQINIDTTIVHAWRGDLQGDPHAGGTSTLGRNLTIELGNEYTFTHVNMPINQVYDIIPLPGVTRSRTIILEPEASRSEPSVYVLQKVTNYSGPGDTDEFGVGVSFQNLLPKEFSHRLVYHYQDSAGTEDVDEWSDKTECSSRTVTSKVPNRPHWVFLGWSESPAGGSTVNAGQQVTVCAEKHLYAQWRYTYRPGQCRHNNVWMSHDRDGRTGVEGCCNVRRGGMWQEMRIDPIHTGLEDPPVIHQGGAWRIQRCIGQGGGEHDIYWNCPHQWR